MSQFGYWIGLITGAFLIGVASGYRVSNYTATMLFGIGGAILFAVLWNHFFWLPL